MLGLELVFIRNIIFIDYILLYIYIIPLTQSNYKFSLHILSTFYFNLSFREKLATVDSNVD